MLCPADCAVVLWLQPVTLLAGQSASAMFVCLFVSVCVCVCVCCVCMCMCTRVCVCACASAWMCVLETCLKSTYNEHISRDNLLSVLNVCLQSLSVYLKVSIPF